MSVAVGELAPDFELKNQFGETVKLSDFRDKKNVVLIFSPKAFTGICTAELCAIRDDKSDFVSDDVVTFGISCDSDAVLKKFAEEENYGYDLLSDYWPHGGVAREFGVFLGTRGFARLAVLSSSTRAASFAGPSSTALETLAQMTTTVKALAAVVVDGLGSCGRAVVIRTADGTTVRFAVYRGDAEDHECGDEPRPIP